MLTKRSLRLLIIAQIVLDIVATVTSSFTESLLPEALRAYKQAVSEAELTSKDWGLLAIGIPLLIAVLASSIGLFVFWPPARRLYLVTTIVLVLLTPFFGPYVDAGWAWMFEGASAVISGVVLALVYFSPLRDFYERPKTTA